MAKSELKIQARQMRRKGISICIIAKKLMVAKSSVSKWCLDIELTNEQKEVLLRCGNSLNGYKGAQANRLKKINNIANAKNWAKKQFTDIIKHRDVFIAGIALYWAEGSKKSSCKFCFSNSDPKMILLMSHWVQSVLYVKKVDLMPRLSINEIHKPRIDVVLRFWSNLLELPISQFGKPCYIKAKVHKKFENHDSYYGVCRLILRRSSIYLYKMMGLMELLTEENNAGVAQLVRADVS